MADSDASYLAHEDIILERSLYIGNILRGILYEVEIFTFFTAVYCICHRSSNYRRRQRSYVIFGGVLLVLVTISVMANSLWGQYMWIEHRNYPGGQLGFWYASQSAWYNVLGFAADATTDVLADGLLLYRCHIIWGSRWYILALPMLIYVASAVLAFVDVLVKALPHSSWTHGTQHHLAIVWVSLSVSLNVIVTSMICFRLLRMRALAREVLTPETSKMYTSIAAMLIESAAPFTILGIIVVVIGAQEKPLTWGFAYIWSMFCSLSPQMIILRVAMGRGWLMETVNEINTTLVFANPPVVQGQSQGVRTTIHITEDSMFGPGTPQDNPNISIKSA